MKTIKVSKAKLINIITANRQKHREQFDLAFEGYRKECIRIMEQNLDLLKSGKRVQVSFLERAPQDHTEDYDRVIQMLEMSVDEHVEIEQQEFSNYVQDDWDWRRSWSASNSKYLTHD